MFRRDRVVIIAVSRLVWHKGYPELAAAMRSVPEAELWVVGERLDSDRGADMAAVLRAAGLGDRLRMLGYRDDIPALLAAADIFTLPSRFEGLPMSVIEAMLTGLPVVATNVRGPAEQVVDGVTGLSVPAGDRGGAGCGTRPTGPRSRFACPDGAGRPAAGAGSATTRPKSSRAPWTCSACRSIPPRLQHHGIPPP